MSLLELRLELGNRDVNLTLLALLFHVASQLHHEAMELVTRIAKSTIGKNHNFALFVIGAQ